MQRRINPHDYRVSIRERDDKHYEFDPHGTRRVQETHERIMAAATGGLVTFRGDEVVLSVDPSKYREVSA